MLMREVIRISNCMLIVFAVLISVQSLQSILAGTPISQNSTLRKLTHKSEQLEGISTFVSLYEAYKPICGDPYHNIVIPRYPPKKRYSYTPNNSSMEWRRPWSIESNLIFSLLGVDVKDTEYVINSKKPVCASVVNLIESLALRVENQPCVLRWYNPAQVCQLLSKFSLVWWHGDSLTRHMMQALFILASGDLQYGGYPPNYQYKIAGTPCGCDGQFSESLQCRDATILQLFQNIYDFSRMGLCTKEVSLHTNFIWTQFSFKNAEPSCRQSSVDRESDVARNGPIFISIEGGVHYENNASLAIQVHFLPLFNHFYPMLSPCINRVHVVFSGMVAVNKTVEEKYVVSRKENVWKFNKDMHGWFNSEMFKTSFPGLKVYFLDLWNITAMNINYTSDGFHSLTDTNLIKAASMLNMMHFLSDRFYRNRHKGKA